MKNESVKAGGRGDQASPLARGTCGEEVSRGPGVRRGESARSRSSSLRAEGKSDRSHVVL